MKFFRRLTKIFTFLLLFASLPVSNAQTKPTDNIFTLQAGTEIHLRMDNEINSKVSSRNDTFSATVSSPVVVRDVEVLPIGAVIEGKIIGVTPASAGKKDGSFELKFETLRLKTAVTRAIEASLITEKTGKNSSPVFNLVAIMGGTAIGAVLGGWLNKSQGTLIGAGVGAGVGIGVTLLKKGKEARIKANEEFLIRLNKEVRLPVEDF